MMTRRLPESILIFSKELEQFIRSANTSDIVLFIISISMVVWVLFKKIKSDQRIKIKHTTPTKNGQQQPTKKEYSLLNSFRQDDDTDSNNENNGITTIAFSNIQLLLNKKKKRKGTTVTTTILNGTVNGTVSSGTMLAILGPSGAGKSSLLHAIAGKIKYNKNLQLYGQRYVNGIPLSNDSILPLSVLIEQDVNFFPHMTVYETILFRIQLQLGLDNPTKNNTIVHEILGKLDLQRVADTIVGDTAKIRGISGGERKRLSIAVEMISFPAVILLDEPTSGLDSTSAFQLVRILRNLASGTTTTSTTTAANDTTTAAVAQPTVSNTNTNKTTIIAVLHQPNQHVFDKFDTVLLVGQNGQQMYYGARDQVRQYLEHSADCPATSIETGTAEHCLDCISNFPMNDTEIMNPSVVQDRINRLILLATKQSQSITVDITSQLNNGSMVEKRYASSTSGIKTSLVVQFQLLLHRSLREVIRSKLRIVLYMVRLVSMAMIYGSIYQLQNTQSSINDRFGLLSLLIIGAANMGMSKTIRTFPKEKAIVSYELACGMYHTLPYFIGKAISEIPVTTVLNSIFGITVYYMTGLDPVPRKVMNFIGLLILHGIVSESVGLVIGSISPNSDIALAIYPAVVVLNIIFDGKNISEENIPRLLRWIPKVGLIRWGFEGLCLNEFNGLVFETTTTTTTSAASNLVPIQTGSEALARFGLLSDRTVVDVVQAQITIALTCWVLSYLGLTLTRQKFLPMDKHSPPAPQASLE